ncbi:hypothetical protein LEMLEM_LOCUS8950, partial [Lemmus lemmus]
SDSGNNVHTTWCLASLWKTLHDPLGITTLIILLSHMAWLRISSIKQEGRSQGQRFIAEWRPLPGRKPSSQLFDFMTMNARQMHPICVYKPVLVGVAVPNRITSFRSTFESIQTLVPNIPFCGAVVYGTGKVIIHQLTLGLSHWVHKRSANLAIKLSLYASSEMSILN